MARNKYCASLYMMNLFESERTISPFFAKHLHICSLLKKNSLSSNIDSLVFGGVCKQHTAPFASNTCHTRFFSCARGSRLKMIELCCSLVFRKSHPISSMFRDTFV